jgi:hypothetical protein
MRKKMNAKRNLVSFLAIATLLLLTTSMVSAYCPSQCQTCSTCQTCEECPTCEDCEDECEEAEPCEIVDQDCLANDIVVEIDGIDVSEFTPSVIVGESITVKVSFTSLVDASDVRIRADLDLNGESVDLKTNSFDVEACGRYVKRLTLVVPEDLDDDELSDYATLDLRIWNGDFENKIENINLKVQRVSYNADIKSIIVSSSLEAGKLSSVDVVLRNSGYNELEDLYVTVRILELGVEKTGYFGDLVALEDDDDDDDKDTVSGRIYLEVPYDVASGIYTLEVEVENDDFSDVVKKEVSITNGFPEVVMKSGNNLLVLNPTDNLKVYKVVYPSEEMTIVVQAGSSKLVSIETPAGEYSFDVFVFDGNKLVGTVNYEGVSESETLTSPVIVLTVILAVIFVVLLVVMIVLITKKPEKAEEFGESYY